MYELNEALKQMYDWNQTPVHKEAMEIIKREKEKQDSVQGAYKK